MTRALQSPALPRSFFTYLASIAPAERDRDLVATAILRSDAPANLHAALVSGLEDDLAGAHGVAAALVSIRSGANTGSAASSLAANHTGADLGSALVKAPENADVTALFNALVGTLAPFHLRGLSAAYARQRRWPQVVAILAEFDRRLADEPGSGAVLTQAITLTKATMSSLSAQVALPHVADHLVLLFTDVLRQPILVRTAACRIPAGLHGPGQTQVTDAVVRHLMLPVLAGTTGGQIPWSTLDKPLSKVAGFLTRPQVDQMQEALRSAPEPTSDRGHLERSWAVAWVQRQYDRLHQTPAATPIKALLAEGAAIGWILDAVELSTPDAWRTLHHLSQTMPPSATVADLADAVNGVHTP